MILNKITIILLLHTIGIGINRTNAQLMMTQKETLGNHGHRLNAIKLSPNQLFIASASSFGDIQIWDIKQKSVRYELKEHGLAVNTIDFSPNGELLASGSDDGSLIIWNVNTGESLREIDDFESPVLTILFINQHNLVCGTEDGYIHYLTWNSFRKKLSRTGSFYNDVGNMRPGITALAYSAQRKILFVGSEDGMIKLWDYKRKGFIDSDNYQLGDIVNTIALTEDEDLLMAGSDNAVLYSWQVLRYSDRLERGEKYDIHNHAIKETKFIGTTTNLVSASADGYLKLWNKENEKSPYKQALLFDKEDLPLCLDVSRDGNLLVVGGELGTINTWKITNGKNPSGSIVNPKRLFTRKDRTSMDRALLFAIDEYDHMNNLNYSINDAVKMKTILEEDYGFTVELVINPTHDQFTNKLYEYKNLYNTATNREKQGQLLILMSGHGIEDYFLLKDSNPTRPFGTAMSYSELRPMLGNDIDCQHILVIIDACKSGSFINQKKTYNGKPSFSRPGSLNTLEVIYQKHLLGTSRIALTSVAESLDSPDESAMMTQLIRSLQNRAKTSNVVFWKETFIDIYEKTLPQPLSEPFHRSDDGRSGIWLIPGK